MAQYLFPQSKRCMKNSQNNNSNSAIVISGIKLVLDLSALNVYSLEILLANMQFFLTKYLPEHAIALYTSQLYGADLSTLVFL